MRNQVVYWSAVRIGDSPNNETLGFDTQTGPRRVDGWLKLRFSELASLGSNRLFIGRRFELGLNESLRLIKFWGCSENGAGGRMAEAALQRARFARFEPIVMVGGSNWG
jgi:hypothetical protein